MLLSLNKLYNYTQTSFHRTKAHSSNTNSLMCLFMFSIHFFFGIRGYIFAQKSVLVGSFLKCPRLHFKFPFTSFDHD